MKKKGSKKTIDCLPNCGPLFGNEYSDICIGDKCNEENSCWITHSSHFQYECHPKYKSSLYVNTNGPDYINYFSVLDYEVYSFDICKEYVYNVCKYPDIIWNYIETKDISEESLRMISNEDEIRNDLNLIQCKDTSIRLKTSRSCLKNRSEYLPDTQLVDKKYDSYLKEWAGDYKWKLIYRSSEHGYTGSSFHEYCDDVNGPTLIVIKSSEGWIFGGYTTQSWSGWSIYNDMILYIIGVIKDDSKAFIFTLKNPHGISPTRYMKKKGSKTTIDCLPNCGPSFGGFFPDIYIGDNCNEENNCWISISSYSQYEYHPEYQSSLYVNTSLFCFPNYFSVLDYEVYSFDICKEYVYNTCKYPDVIWNYIETKDISEDSLKQFADDIELLNDLNLIQCKDTSIRLKISYSCLRNRSEYLPDTQIVDIQYDVKFLEWLGDCKWKLIYRSSEHGYTGKSFHEYCDNNGPTLVIIKSSGGWIFGGYTTQSWSGDGIYYDDLCIINQ